MMANSLKTLSLICLLLVLLLSPIAVRLMPDIQPVEYKYVLIRDWSNYAVEFIIVISMLLFLFSASLNRKPLVSRSPFDFWIGLLFLLSALSSLYTIDLRLTLRASVDLGVFIILYFLARNLLSEPKYHRLFLSLLLGIAVALSIYGIYQYLFEYGKLSKFIDCYIAKDTLDTRWDLVRGSVAQRRISSAFGLHNMFASFLGMLIPIAFSLCWYAKERRDRIEMFVVVFILLTAMLFTFSIGGALSLFIALGIELVLLMRVHSQAKGRAEKKRILVRLISCLSILVIVVSLIVGIKRFPSLIAGSIRYRWMYLVSTLKIIKDNFLIGTGWGTFENAYLKYMAAGRLNSVLDYATLYSHNLYLQIFSELGIIGFAALLGFVVKMVFCGFKKIAYLGGEYLRPAAIGVFSGLCFFLIHNVLDVGFYFFPVSIYFWFLLGSFANLTVPDNAKRFLKLDIFIWALFSLFLLFQILKNSFADILFYRGSAALSKGSYAQALNKLKTALKMDSANARYLEKLGDIYRMKASSSRTKEDLFFAKNNYLHALKFSKWNPELNYKLGIIAYMEGDLQNAINYLKTSVYYYPAQERYRQDLKFLNKQKEALDR